MIKVHKSVGVAWHCSTKALRAEAQRSALSSCAFDSKYLLVPTVACFVRLRGLEMRENSDEQYSEDLPVYESHPPGWLPKVHATADLGTYVIPRLPAQILTTWQWFTRLCGISPPSAWTG